MNKSQDKPLAEVFGDVIADYCDMTDKVLDRIGNITKKTHDAGTLARIHAMTKYISEETDRIRIGLVEEIELREPEYKPEQVDHQSNGKAPKDSPDTLLDVLTAACIDHKAYLTNTQLEGIAATIEKQYLNQPKSQIMSTEELHFTKDELERLSLAGIMGGKAGTNMRNLYKCVKAYQQYYDLSMEHALNDIIKVIHGFVEIKKEDLVIIPKVPAEDREELNEGVKPPSPLPPPKRSIKEDKEPSHKPTQKSMTKYRIVEIPQPDGGDKYRVQICKLERDAWWKFNNKIIDSWRKIIIDSEFIGPGFPRLPICLSDFDTEKEAQSYIDYLKRQSKVVFETEI